MKKTYHILLITFAAILLHSCSIYENVYFAEDGQIKYEMLIDGSDMLSAMPDMSSKINESKEPLDTVISFREELEKKYMSDSGLSPEQKEMLDKVKPFNLRINNDPAQLKLSVILSGDFANAKSMNEAFDALTKLKEENNVDSLSMQAMPIRGLDKLVLTDQFEWSTTQMTRRAAPQTAINTETAADNQEEDEDENEGEDSGANDKDKALMQMIFGSRNYTVKYHFPRRVKAVSNKDALLSQDGKTVILSIPMSAYNNNKSVVDIDIELEK